MESWSDKFLHPVFLVLILAIASFLVYQLTSLVLLPLPPGPPPKFISGNIHQVSRTEPWKVFAKWAHEFNNPLIFYRIFGRKYVVINSVQAAMALLEGRSAIYSDRPMAWMYKELIGRGSAVFNISSESPRHKIYRKLLHSGLNPRAVQKYTALQERETCILLRGLLDSPDKFARHIRRNAGAVILQIAYGWTVEDEDDYFVTLMEESFKLHTEILRPGRFLVDVFPILRFIPSWFPGAYFQRYAKEVRKRYSQLDLAPHAWVKDQIASGEFNESFTSHLLLPEDGHKLGAEEEDIVKWCAAALYAGGADTTVSAMQSFIALMMQHPEVQTKAQEEINRVVGNDRLPSLDDQPQMVYISALIRELLRYAPVAPMGLPHRVIQQDEYAGYRIPKGATVMANIWALTRDASVYPNPMNFDPDRFLPGPSEQLDSRKLIFGFGRRVCPGAHFAELSLFLNITSILAVFDIKKPLDETGKQFEPEISYTTAVTSHPKPFQCRIVLRAKEDIVRVIRSQSAD